MIKFDDLRARKLVQLARERFDYDLSDAELKVLRDSASSGDVSEPNENAPRPEVRSELVRWLATDPETAGQIDPKGIRVYGVTLPTKLDLEGSRISVRLDFRRCTVKGDVNLDQAETRDILFWDSSVDDGCEFHADTIDLHGFLQLHRSSFSGQIHLGGAKIEGDLDCSGAKLTVEEGIAFFADGAEIGGDAFLRVDRKASGDVILREDFKSSGTIRLLGAKINGDLDCSGAKLEVKKGGALATNGAKVGGDVFLRGGFVSSGKISLRGMQAGGQVRFFGASVACVDCTNMESSGDFYWMGIEQSGTTSLDLRGASVKNLCDDEESWPQTGNLFLNGFTYGELSLHNRPAPQQIADQSSPQALTLDAMVGTRKRIQWLERQPDEQRIKPQPWVQLSKYLEARGQHREAKHVLFELGRLQAGELNWHPWQWILGILSNAKRLFAVLFLSWRKDHPAWPYLRHPNRSWAIAFAWLEEAPIRILYTITFAVALGWLVFGYAASNRALAPTDGEAYKAFTAEPPQALPATYPKLNPFIYTLENAVPLAKLGQDDKWAPDPQYASKAWFTGYWFLMWFRWLLILSGWFQAAVLGAVLLGRFKE